MKRWAWPRPPVALGLILGPFVERYLDLSVSVFGWSWLGRPIVVGLLIAVVATIVVAVRRQQSFDKSSIVEE